MAELNKRMNAGWILRDYLITSDNHQHYYLMRGTLECEIELKPNGYGYVYTGNKTRRI